MSLDDVEDAGIATKLRALVANRKPFLLVTNCVTAEATRDMSAANSISVDLTRGIDSLTAHSGRDDIACFLHFRFYAAIKRIS